MKGLWIFVAIALTALGACGTWNATADWSDETNPFGQFSLYKSPSALFTTHFADWGFGQPGWADEPYPQMSHVPLYMKAASDSSVPGVFAREGQLVGHTSESERTGTEISGIVWTSPIAGEVRVFGGTWYAHWGAPNRPQLWTLSKNGVPLSSGSILIDDGSTMDSPRDFSNGSGGLAALTQSVSVGDRLQLIFQRQSTGTPGAFVGYEFCIRTSPFLGVLAGTIQLEDLAASPAGRNVVIEVRRSDGALVMRRVTTSLDATGAFSTPICLEGTYSVGIKSSHWLRQVKQEVILESGALGVSFSLVNGDCDGDNEISLADYALLAGAFGTAEGDSNWNPVADLDGDGEVTLSDYSILSRNFGQSGD